MAIRFNADEALKIAERIEGNAEAFYRKAARLFPEERTQDLLHKLAIMEDEHRVTFASMRAALPDSAREPTAYDPQDESLLYLKAMADQHGGEGSPAAADELTGREPLEKVIRTAIDLEHKTILFYVGLRDLVPANLGRDKIDRIIHEEKSHVVSLSRELNAIRPKS